MATFEQLGENYDPKDPTAGPIPNDEPDEPPQDPAPAVRNARGQFESKPE